MATNRAKQAGTNSGESRAVIDHGPAPGGFFFILHHFSPKSEKDRFNLIGTPKAILPKLRSWLKYETGKR